MLAARPDPHPQPAFAGLYAGVVTAVEDTSFRGRVQVAVPSVFGSDATDAAVWARPCFPAGQFSVPDTGDRVWVAFEDGNPAAPVWLGIWYPPSAVPGDAQVSPPRRRLLRSVGGHQILFDDTSGAARVVVVHSGGAQIEMTATDVTISAPTNLTVSAGTSIVLRAPSVDVRSS